MDAQFYERLYRARKRGRSATITPTELDWLLPCLPLFIEGSREPKDHVKRTRNRREIVNRWMCRDDLPAVLAIEDDSFSNPWSEEDFVQTLRQRNVIGQVATHGGEILGYSVYELYRTRIEILSFAVARKDRRQGVGSQIIRKLIGKLSHARRRCLDATVRETNLEAQQFLRTQGFRAVEVFADYYDDIDIDEDAYKMRVQIEIEGEQYA